MPFSSAIASNTMSRPSSDLPIVKISTRGDASASVRAYAYARAESTNSPGAPGMRFRNCRGEGTDCDAGRYDTHGDRNCGAVVAFAISSTEPGSAPSGAMLWALRSEGIRTQVENRIDK